MASWIKKINWKKVVIVALIYTISATVIHQLEAVLTMGYYQDPQYFGVWSKTMMPTSGPPPMTFFLISMIFTFTSGLCLTLVYYYLRELLPANVKHRIFLFADLLIGLQFVFFTLPVYLLFNVPVGLLISWFISSFIILTFTSFTLVKVIK